MSYVAEEIVSQPDLWLRAADAAGDAAAALPRPGERVAVVGCGTSWFMAMAYANLREAAGQGETDAFAGSEFPIGRPYDRIIAITRSGTTTEVLDILKTAGARSTVLVGDVDTPAVTLARDVIALPWADERSVVQTRFATSALALLRASLGEDLTAAAADARRALALPLPLDPAAIEQVTFVGRGWTNGLAQEAALKCREAATFWTEAYPAMDFRHGPISISTTGRAVWAFGEVPAGLRDDVAATGAAFVHAPELDPMAHLVVAQRFAVALAEHKGLNPDAPRHLTRSVILP
ncbi:SIS domain-containing protein [Catellatospora tritici]|uniref:SIS domain-containing protein n=1 Tax=Catellatospora tritici TaxID=2851566 RepID=UPI001C2CDF0D|nr:sugar isomerase [Catellatospora tritici]MBV1855372.1 sugar isomerase [Catellatospora tritici]